MNNYLQQWLTIGQLAPIDTIKQQAIETAIDSKLPQTLALFLKRYGYGSINDFIIIMEPDAFYFRESYGDYLHFWKFESESLQAIIKNSITIGWTIDGDILTFEKRGHCFYFLPRHSNEIGCFEDFDQLLLYIIKTYQFTEPIYFDSSYQRETIFFKLVKNDQLIDIHPIHTQFVQHFSYTIVINEQEQQPLYILPNIGGWVRFDLCYKNSISLKYQQPFHEQVKEYITFFNEQLENSN